MLYSQDVNKYFFPYTFSSETSLVDVLNQKDDLNNKQPISFMSVSLQGPGIN